MQKNNRFSQAQQTANPQQAAQQNPAEQYWDAQLQNPNAVIQIGEGERVFKEPLSKEKLQTFILYHPSLQDLNEIIRDSLAEQGYNPEVNYTEEQKQKFLTGVRQKILQSPIGSWVKQMNPDLLR